MRDLRTEWLRSLVAVAAFSGVTEAASALHLTRAAVSQHIKKLERELGCVLVTRQGRGITLTADGEVLAGRARLMLELHDDAIQELAPPGSKDIVVAATEHAAEFLVPELMNILRAAYPDFAFRLRLTRSEKARGMYQHSRADVALILRHQTPGAVKVADLPLEWVGRDSDSQVNGEPDVVVFDRPCAVRDVGVAALASTGYNIVRECADLAGVLSAVLETGGVSPLPRTGPRPKGLAAISSLPPMAPVPLYMVTSDRIEPPVRSAILAALRNRLADGLDRQLEGS